MKEAPKIEITYSPADDRMIARRMDMPDRVMESFGVPRQAFGILPHMMNMEYLAHFEALYNAWFSKLWEEYGMGEE